MPQVYTAFASEVKVNEETIDGLQSIEYAVRRIGRHVGAIGTDERIAVYFGMKVVDRKLTVASVNATLDGFLAGATRSSRSAPRSSTADDSAR